MPVYTDSRGQWRAQVRPKVGKSYSRAFQSKREAQRWYKRERQNLKQTRRDEPGAVTFAELAAAYMGDAEMSRSKENALRHITDLLGHHRIKDMTSKDVIEFARRRISEGAGPATVLQDLSYTGTIIVHGAAAMGVNPADAKAAVDSGRAYLRQQGMASKSQERDRRPSEEELIALRDLWLGNVRQTIPMWTLTQFAAATAMRLSEITRLEWDHFDAEARTILIKDRKHPRSKKGNDQTVPLPAGHLAIDGEVIDPVKIILEQPTRFRRGRIFPFDAASVSTAFTRGTRTCEIDDLRFHDLRHEGCSRLAAAGFDVVEISAISGHKDLKMLQRYVNVDAADASRIAHKLAVL